MRRIYAIIAIAVSCLVMTTCKKDKEPVPPVFKFNEVEASDNSAKITGEYEYEGELKNLTLLYGKDPQLVDAGKKDVEVDGRLFSVTVDDLESETKYYYGIECKTTYSSIRTKTESFMTKKTVSMAEVTTNEVTAVATSTATSGGTVTSDGNAAVAARGVCWSTSPYPTPEEDSFTEDGTGTGSFVSYISGLTENTKYYVRAYAANEKGTAYGEQKEFTTLSSEGLPTVTTNEVTDITTNSATSGGTVTSDGGATITARGVCWSTSPYPTPEEDSFTEDGTGTGSFVSYIYGLTENTKYYVRAYAANEKGTAYGEQKEFTTLSSEGLPTVTTNEVTDITTNSATSGGNVTSDGNASVTAKGICWSTTPNPTVANEHTEDGTGTGSFVSYMTGLNHGTKYYVRAYATNRAGTAYGEQKEFTTEVNEELPIVTTNEVTNITQTTATSGGNVTSDGNATVTARGVCWSTSQNPTIDDNKTTDGSGTGTYTSNISNLTHNTKYYVRAYATNEKGTSYGEQKEFTTMVNESMPVVTTNEITGITQTTATSGGNVTSDGNAAVTARGVCWSTSQNPTISNSHTTDGNGTGSFTSSITGLTANTTYYVRAYATNEKGTSYGEQKSFKTLQNIELPTVTTTNVSNITQTTATSGGNVTDDGGATLTARGVCWSTSQNPTIDDNKTTDGNGTGSFTSNMTGLTANTTYYVRAYATNEKGTAYGEQRSFTTLQNIELPTVTTTNVSNITQTTATSGGNVTSDGNATVTARGVCWSTSQNPTIDDNKTTDGSGTGTYTSNISNLTHNTKYYVRAYATNEKGTSYGEQKEFTTMVNESMPVVTTNEITGITQTTATSGGNVTSDGNAAVTARGVCWSTSQNPTISNSHTTDGNGTGSFTSNITGLTANTTYYVRAYATNEKGTSYGEQKSFTTLQNIELPTVTTTNVSNITQTTATSGGNVTSDGNATVTARGVCWSTSQNPTISNSHTTDGNGTGSFTSNMTGLTANTTYYVRAYATNEKGTAYGEQRSFTTLQNIELPTVTTTNVSNITQTTATSGGNVTSDGNATVTARGVCWSTSQNPTISNSHTTDGNGTGSFTSNITGLTANTTYYVRAYATNEKGTSYGEQKSFMTLQNIELPTVTTTNVSNITQTTATSGGNVTSDGGANVTARGVCWSTSQNPTISNSHTADGNGTGSFTSSITGLTANTTYYVRAYATNEKGTAYGEQRSFTTLQNIELPTLTTTNVSNITQTTATSGGNVTSDGGANVTARGVCWSTSQNPTISNSHTTDGNGTGSFTSSITGLTANTTYYVRAYATNEKGTAYGEQRSFTTLDPPTINGHEYVDLGLPSGLKWATCNVGASSPEDYGDYYAWGETTTKSTYTKGNSATYGLTISELQSQGYIDGSGNLTPSHDAATANWGGSWRMPTREEQEELIDECTWSWITQNGVKVYKVTGPNGNIIFLPATGFRGDSWLNYAGERGYYWSSTPFANNAYGAYFLIFDSSIHYVDWLSRYYGYSVRPVSE